MERSGVWMAVIAMAVLGVEGLSAQACIGYPQGSSAALTATFSFPEDATGYDLSGMVGSRHEGVFFEGGFGIVAPDDEEGLDQENTKSVHGTGAYEVYALAPDASLCPAVGIDYAWVDDLNLLTVPFGVGVGTTAPLGRRGNAGLTPFAIPHFLYERSSVDDVEDSEESDIFVGIQAGLTLHVQSFRVTGVIHKVFEDERDAVFSLGVGAAWD